MLNKRTLQWVKILTNKNKSHRLKKVEPPRFINKISRTRTK